jgi:hypothetical protein
MQKTTLKKLRMRSWTGILFWRHNIEHNDTRDNDPWHTGRNFDNQHKWHSV